MRDMSRYSVLCPKPNHGLLTPTHMMMWALVIVLMALMQQRARVTNETYHTCRAERVRANIVLDDVFLRNEP